MVCAGSLCGAPRSSPTRNLLASFDVTASYPSAPQPLPPTSARRPRPRLPLGSSNGVSNAGGKQEEAEADRRASVLSSCNVSISKRHRSEGRGPPARVCGQWGKFSPWQPVRAQLQISSRSFFSLNRPPISTSEMQIYPGKLCFYLLNLATLPTMPERQF